MHIHSIPTTHNTHTSTTCIHCSSRPLSVGGSSERVKELQGKALAALERAYSLSPQDHVICFHLALQHADMRNVCSCSPAISLISTHSFPLISALLPSSTFLLYPSCQNKYIYYRYFTFLFIFATSLFMSLAYLLYTT